MMKTLTTVTAAATLVAALAGAPTDAVAQRRGAAIGLGILGGVAAGAIIGGAIANSYGPAYVVQPGYVPYSAYEAGPPVGCPGGYWARVPVYDPYGNVVGYRGRPRFFCPSSERRSRLIRARPRASVAGFLFAQSYPDLRKPVPDSGAQSR